MADAYKGFTKMFCDEDGFLIDLTDKAGRDRDRQFMLSLQSRLDASVQRIEQDMQQHYKAKLHPKDKQMFETLNRNFDITRYWVFGSCFLGAAFLILGLFLVVTVSSNLLLSKSPCKSTTYKYMFRETNLKRDKNETKTEENKGKNACNVLSMSGHLRFECKGTLLSREKQENLQHSLCSQCFSFVVKT